MLLKRYVLFCGLMVFSVPSIVWSETVRIDWSGEISTSLHIPDTLATQFAAGDTVSGSFIYDSNEIDTSPGGDGSWNISDYDFSIGNYSATATGGKLDFFETSGEFHALTSNTFGLNAPVIPVSVPTPPPSLPTPLQGVAFSMVSSTITTDSLPLPADAASLTSAFTLFFGGGNNMSLQQTSISLNDIGGGQIQAEWTGEIQTSTNIPEALSAQFAPGDVVTGRFTYASNATDMSPDGNGAWAISDYEFTIGSYTASAPGGQLTFSEDNDQFDALTNPVYGLDAPAVPAPVVPPPPPPPPIALQTAILSIVSPTLVSDRLPLPADAADSIAAFTLFFQGLNPLQIFPISIDITAVSDTTPSPIPIPATVWLFGTALVGLVGFSNRRKAA